MRFILTGVIISILFGLTSNAQAQKHLIIRGQVRDASTNLPVPFASIYLNISTRGTTSDEAGKYQLTGVPAGTVEIVASSVGYKALRQTIRISNEQNRVLDFALIADAKDLQTINITAKRSNKYDHLLKKFKQELLGNTAFADKCLINNLEKVAVTIHEGKLEAQASEPIVIDNKALGYRLYYTLTHFDSFRQATHYAGTSRFEVLTPDNAGQAERWERNRLKAYQGSIRHLLASLVAGTHEQEGFLVYQANFNVPPDASVPIAQLVSQRPITPVQPNSLFKPGELSFERQLISPKPLEIFYTHRHVISTPYRDLPYAYSILYLPKRSAVITTDGWIVQPNGLEVRGSMSDDRLATLLPLDWKPAGQNVKLGPKTPDEGVILPADTVVKALANQWSNQQKKVLPSIFLHLDKNLYLTGDHIWFSGYVLNASTHQPLEKADSPPPLHVELISPSGRRIGHQWARVVDGRTSGNFRLSDSLSTGRYRLLAYCEMDAGNTRPAFEQIVSIINGPSSGIDIKLVDSTTTTDSLDVQFLPEGGHWVAGLPARVGIKATDKRGKGIAITGRILSIQGAEVGHFVTNRWGMGSVELVPLPNQRYRADMHTPAGPLVALLPPTDASGLVLAADIVTDSTQLIVGVQASSQLAHQPVYLTVQSRGQLLQQIKLQLQDAKARLSIPAARLPVGLVQVTLFDAQGTPKAERLVFIPERFPPIVADVTTDKTRYQPRESVNLTVRVADGFDEPLSIIGSASITDAGQVPADTNEANILTHLLLTGDLRGRVEDAHFYLSNNQLGTRRALDDLLLTQGWRRLSWRFITDQPKSSVPTVTGLGLRGRVVDKKNKAVPNANVLLTFTSKTGDSFARSARSDQQGRFVVDDLLLLDTVSVRTRIMTTGFQLIPNARVVIDLPGSHFPPPAPSVLSGLNGLKPFLSAMQQRQASAPEQYRDRDARQLAEVTVRAAKPNEDRPARRISLHGSADATILFDEKSRTYENAYEMLHGNAPGVQVRRKGINEPGGESGGYNVTVRGVGSFSDNNSPLYLVDGSYFEENSQGTVLLMVNPNDIERIEVIKNAGGAIYGARGGAGVIAFYSKTNRSSETVSPKEPALPLYGYPTERQFYVPRYNSGSDEIVNQSDRRDVLYWKPLLATNRLGLTTLQFPLSDVSRTIRLTVQGVTTFGRPIYISRLVKVL